MQFRRFTIPLLRTSTVVAIALLGSPSPTYAHEIPTNATVTAFVKPDGGTLQVLVRVPLASMRDIDFPVDGPGFLRFSQADEFLFAGAKTWIQDYVTFFEDGRPLPDPRIAATRVSIPSDRSFASYETALANLLSPRLPDETQLVWEVGLLDVLFEYAITSEGSNFSIRPEWAHLGVRTNTILRFLPPGGTERVFQYMGDPGLVRLDPRWFHAASTFTRLGFEHILGGIDHLLFILCLVIPFRRFRPLVAVVTSFTVAHSITLGAAALGFVPSALWFPSLIEVLIALSIVWMAFENIAGVNLQRRWMMAFGFGLIHGFGFSFLLTESLQFAGSHLLLSLLAFNVGVELGQIAVLLVAIPLLALLFRYVVPEKTGAILLSALVAHSAWHWMTDRGAELMEYQFAPPVLDTVFLAASMRWMMLLLIAMGVMWVMYEVIGRFTRQARPGGAATG